MLDVVSILNHQYPGDYLVVKESHRDRDDFHYHIILIVNNPLSKNTYKKRFDETFDKFSSRFCIRREGVKSKKALLAYIMKDQLPTEVIKFMKGEKIESFLTNIDPYFFKTTLKGVG